MPLATSAARDDAAQHHELALCEIHDTGDVGSQNEAKRHQRIHATGREPGQEQLEEDRKVHRPHSGALYCASTGTPFSSRPMPIDSKFWPVWSSGV